MILTLDIGNTRIKCAVFEQDTLIDKIFLDQTDFAKNIENILIKFKNIQNIVVSSVGVSLKNELLSLQTSVNVIFIDHETLVPFNNLYETPTTLGIDRIVLATGAVLQFPFKNRLVIDAGTCVTYDYINENNEYLGGAISPGLRLRYESLNNYTAKLPLLTLESPRNLVGNSTKESIHSGVVNGLLNEIDGFIDQFQINKINFIIILTGGDADFLAKRLKNTIFANSNFLLESLNQIYHYSNQND